MNLVALARNLAVGVLTSSLFFSACLAIWATRHGWDLIDGGAYYLSYKDPADVADIQTSYHILAGWIFRLCHENIVCFRLLSWLTIAIAVFGFVHGLLAHLQFVFRKDLPPISTCSARSFIFLSGFAAFISAPAALTYNSLNVACILVAVGFLLSSTGRMLVGHKQDWLGWAELSAACVVTGIELAIKPPTSLFLFGAILAFCLLSPLLPLRFKAQLLTFVIGGMAIGVAMIAVFLRSFSALYLRLSDLLRISHNSAYKVELLTRLLGDLRDLGGFIWSDLQLPLLIVLFAIIMSLGASAKRYRARVVAAGFSLAACITWLCVAIYERLWEAGHVFFKRAVIARSYLEAIALCVAVLLIFHFALPKEKTISRTSVALNVHLALLCLMLIFLPFAGSFGTTNPIYLNAGFQAACWGGTIVVLLVIIARRLSAPAVLPMALLPIGMFATAQFINGHILHPYALRTNLFEQDTPTAIGSPATILLLDGPTSAFIRESRQALDANGFKPGDDIFAFFNLPGLVFALGGRSPIIPWYFGRIYNGDAIEESYMAEAGEERRRRAWIITQADVTVFREHFHRGGLEFPEDYSVIGRLTNPSDALDVKIWKRRDMAK